MHGNLQKGSLDIMGAVVELVVRERPDLDWVLRIQNPNMCSTFEVAAKSKESAVEWMTSIKKAAQNASARVIRPYELLLPIKINRGLSPRLLLNTRYIFIQENQHKEMERTWRVAKEISDLTVYCRSVQFNMERIKLDGFIFYEMSSFPELKAEKLICQQDNKFFLKYHQVINKGISIRYL